MSLIPTREQEEFNKMFPLKSSIKGQWIKYTGSNEQIDEIVNCKDGFIIQGKKAAGKDDITYPHITDPSCIDMYGVTHYLIRNPHPLRDMIKRQADTGQEVWVKEKSNNCIYTYMTTNPNWNIPNAEYSFKEFE